MLMLKTEAASLVSSHLDGEDAKDTEASDIQMGSSFWNQCHSVGC